MLMACCWSCNSQKHRACSHRRRSTSTRGAPLAKRWASSSRPSARCVCAALRACVAMAVRKRSTVSGGAVKVKSVPRSACSGSRSEKCWPAELASTCDQRVPKLDIDTAELPTAFDAEVVMARASWAVASTTSNMDPNICSCTAPCRRCSGEPACNPAVTCATRPLRGLSKAAAAISVIAPGWLMWERLESAECIRVWKPSLPDTGPHCCSLHNDSIRLSHIAELAPSPGDAASAITACSPRRASASSRPPLSPPPGPCASSAALRRSLCKCKVAK
mmetsp:Transcript_49632/g.87343  ORF Transcript_49632/g.87343 Transcript_49632/m.87343 type:complete len:276 (+) Transcript_49632:558-1385(+)